MEQADTGKKTRIFSRSRLAFSILAALLVCDTALAAGQSLCLNNRSGRITAKRRCSGGELVLDAEMMSALAAGARTQAGAQGPAGPEGPMGPRGERGDKGERGEKGDRGDIGPAGQKGDKGETGAIGPKGDNGNQGIQGPMGETGPLGARGEKGDQGQTGAQGPAGFSGYEIVEASNNIITARTSKAVSATCPAGKVVLGGGMKPSVENDLLYVQVSAPVGTSTWRTKVANTSSSNTAVTAYAVCAYSNN